jgi:Tol biopolymer transport system component
MREALRRELPLQKRRRITWIVVGGVAVLLVLALVDALRSSEPEPRPPGAEGSPTTIRTIGTVAEASDADQEDVADASTTPAEGAPVKTKRASRPYLLDLRTGESTRLAKSLARGRDFAASPDGTRLAYVARGGGGNPQIFIARIDGTRVRQMTHEPRGAAWPAWSPDGRMIAYEDGSGGHRNLFVLERATGRSSLVTGESMGGGSQFTPDGSALVYTGGENAYPELRTVPVTGGKSTLVVDLDGGLEDSGDGSFSPDGSRVTFLGGGSPTPAGHCGPCRLVANSDGTDRRIVFGCYPSNPAGTWSPDGSRIVCRAGAAESSIVVVDMTSGSRSRIARGRSAVWVDDRTLLIEP